MTLNCIAVDDEPLSLAKTAHFVSQVPYLSLAASFPSALEAHSYLKEHTVDLMFLDIQMDEMTGIQFLELLRPRPLVIFTTAYDHYALRGYELDVCDYLLKPFSLERFVKAVDKAYQIIGMNSREQAKREDHLFVKTNNKYERIDFGDILFVESKGDYLLIVTAEGRTMTLMTLKNMEDLLPSRNFIRVHKSFIVALDKVKSVEYGRVHVAGHIIPVGDAYRDTLRRSLQL
jgi:DNA-binding LytR/AlgR family response regulator